MSREYEMPSRKAPPTLHSGSRAGYASSGGAGSLTGVASMPGAASIPGAASMPGAFGMQGDASYYAKQESKKMADASVTSKTSSDHDSAVEASLAPPAIPLDKDHFQENLLSPRKPWVIPAVLMALIAALAIVIPVSVILSKEEDTVQRTNIRSTPAPLVEKPNMTLEELQALVPNLTEDTLYPIITDPSSPQAMALDWVNSHSNWDEFEDWRKVQRYAMTVLFFALDGNGWGRQRADWTSRFIHECEWMQRYGYLRVCNDQDQFSTLQLDRAPKVRSPFPPEMYLLPHLESISFKRCDVGGHIADLFSGLPDDLSQSFPSLNTLNLTDVMLVGVIPSSLATLTLLNTLQLDKNELTSTVPSELGLLTNLEWLDLARNQLTGTIPVELGELTALYNVSMQENMFSEEPLPFCYEGSPVTVLATDWCKSQDECCSNP